MYFCTACSVYVQEASAAEHDQSTAHLLSTTKAPTLRKVWLPESNRGYRLLMNMGWKEDTGLGPTGAGRIEPVATVLKNDRAGVDVQPAAKLARVTHFPAHDEQQQRTSSDGLSDAQRMQERLARKRKQNLLQQRMPSQAERKARKLQDQQRDRALGRELYGSGLEGYEDYLQ
ncbi:G patch domain and ankyrin repeat-containing protein 1 [Globisporangium polare]